MGLNAKDDGDLDNEPTLDVIRPLPLAQIMLKISVSAFEIN